MGPSPNIAVFRREGFPFTDGRDVEFLLHHRLAAPFGWAGLTSSAEGLMLSVAPWLHSAVSTPRCTSRRFARRLHVRAPLRQVRSRRIPVKGHADYEPEHLLRFDLVLSAQGCCFVGQRNRKPSRSGSILFTTFRTPALSGGWGTFRRYLTPSSDDAPRSTFGSVSELPLYRYLQPTCCHEHPRGRSISELTGSHRPDRCDLLRAPHPYACTGSDTKPSTATQIHRCRYPLPRMMHWIDASTPAATFAAPSH